MAFVICFVLAITLHSYLSSGACPRHCKVGRICNATDSGCPECEQAYYGRKCQHRMECRFTVKGEGYRGLRNTTSNGRTCQRWDSETPHAHNKKYQSEEENYCRNPDDDGRPWCYTTDRNERLNTVRYQCVVINECDPPKLNPYSRILRGITFHYGDKVTFVCETGYFIQGPTLLTCQANKTWDMDPPTCKIAECTLPSLPETIKVQHPKQTYTYGDVIAFYCTEGFEFHGGNTSNCQTTAQWSEPFPVCEKINCIDLKSSAHLLISNPKNQEYNYMDKISFTCEEGYKLSHNNELECQANGLWDKEQPFCIEICNKLSTSQWVGITVGLNFATALMSIFVTLLIMRRFRSRDKTNDTRPAMEMNKTNESPNYVSIDAET